MTPLAFSRAALSLSLFVVGSGCIRTATNDPVTNCIEQAKISCAFAYRCCVEADERERFMGALFAAHRTEGECVQAHSDLCEGVFPYQRFSVERGRTELDADKVNGCLDARRSALDACDLEALREEEEDCEEQLIGLVEDGDACVTSDECADGGTCEVEYDDDGNPEDVDEELAVAEGECKEPPGEGDACPDYECAEGLYCDGDVCRRPAGPGDACPDFECVDGYSCQDPDGDFEYTCEELLRIGEPCEGDSDCASDFCNEDAECASEGDDEDLDYCEG